MADPNGGLMLNAALQDNLDRDNFRIHHLMKKANTLLVENREVTLNFMKSEAQLQVSKRSNNDLGAKNAKLEEELQDLRNLLAIKEAPPKEDEAGVEKLKEDVAALEKKVGELTAQIIVKDEALSAAKLIENALSYAEKERLCLQMNYDLDKEEWKNKEAKYNKKLEQLAKEGADLKANLGCWKETTEETITALKNTVKQKEALLEEKDAWVKKEKLYKDLEETEKGERKAMKATIDQMKKERKILFENDQSLTEENANLLQAVTMLRDDLKTQESMTKEVATKLEAETQRNHQLLGFLSSANEQKTLVQRENVMLQERNSRLEKKDAAGTCQICYENTVQNLFGCGHLACDGCFVYLNCCHICRKEFTEVQKIYFT